jgi:hypothetical protein
MQLCPQTRMEMDFLMKPRFIRGFHLREKSDSEQSQSISIRVNMSISRNERNNFESCQINIFHSVSHYRVRIRVSAQRKNRRTEHILETRHWNHHFNDWRTLFKRDLLLHLLNFSSKTFMTRFGWMYSWMRSLDRESSCMFWHHCPGNSPWCSGCMASEGSVVSMLQLQAHFKIIENMRWIKRIVQNSFTVDDSSLIKINLQDDAFLGIFLIAPWPINGNHPPWLHRLSHLPQEFLKEPIRREQNRSVSNQKNWIGQRGDLIP